MRDLWIGESAKRLALRDGRLRRPVLAALPLALLLGPAPARAQSTYSQVVCPAGETTTISGTVYDPAGINPLPNVLVYVPGANVQPFTDGVNTSDPVLDSYANLVSGSPLVQTTTGINGSFTLSDVPAGTNVPLVIQSGRWRRQFVIAQVTACGNTPLFSAPASPPSTTTVGATETEPSGLNSSNVTQGGSSSLTGYGEPTTVRFARNQEEGDIPHIALVTGEIDALECTLRKAGISDSEFTDLSVGINSTSSDPSAGPTGRVNLYNGIGNSGVSAPSYYTSTQPVSPSHLESYLMGTGSGTAVATGSGLFADNYNVLLLPCQADPSNYTSLQGETNAAGFINSGGRIFATHHSAFYIDNPNGETSSQDSIVYNTALAAENWNNGDSGPYSNTTNVPVTINQSFPDGATLAEWLQNLGATTQQGSTTLNYVWNNQSGVDSAYNTLSWAKDTTYGDVMQLSFYAPVCSDGCSQFGQVMYNEYHVDNAQESASTVFPNECVDDSGSNRAKSSPMSPQELMLEYSLFNMMSFAVPTLTPPEVTISADSPGSTGTPVTFTDGETDGTLTFSVYNPNSTAITTYPTVTLNISLPSGMSAVSMIDPSGGWSCSVATLGCTLMHPIDAGATDSVTVAVTVTANAPATNQAVVGATASSSAFSSSATQDLIISTLAAPPNTVTSPTMTNLPNTPVGPPTPGTSPISIGVSSGTDITGVAVVTEGIPNLDFTLASKTCSGTYSSPSSCTVTVNFSPKAPGLRLGAVEIFGSGNLLLNTAYVSGVGMGAEAALEPGTLSTLLSSGLSSPSDLTADVAGNLYISSSGNNQIVKLAQGGSAATLFAGGGAVCSSPSDSVGDGCPATESTLNSPQGIALDGAGNLYIADQGDDILREVSAVTGRITKVAGTLGSKGDSGDGGPATAATFEKLSAVAVDGAGNLYVADADACVVREITSADGEINTIAGTGACGYTASSGMAVNMKVGAPSALALDSSGNLYIADTSNYVVWKLTLSSGSMSVTAGTLGQGGSSSGDGGAATSATFSQPAGVAVDAAGDLYVLDNNATATRLRMVSASTSIITTIAGGGSQSGSGVPATQAALTPGGGVALDAAGDLYLIATGTGSVQEIASTAATMPFPTPTPVGSTDSTDGVQTVTLTDIGNQDLAAVAPGIAATDSTDFVQQTGASSACTASFSLGFGLGCALSYQFAPQTPGPLTSKVTLTDNSYQAALNSLLSTPQSLLLSGSSGTDGTATTVSPAQAVFSTSAQSVTLSATVTDTTNRSTTVSAGTVTFTVYSGTTLIGTAVSNVAVSNGTASASYMIPAGTAAGGYTVTAVYSGTTNFSASTSTGGTLTIGPAQATLTITGPSSGIYGGSATVTFSGSYYGTPTLSSSTQSVCTVSGATVTFVGTGACTLTAGASAGGNYQAVTSTPDSFNVSTATPTLILSPTNPASISYGTSTTLSVTVAYSGSTPPTGTVTISAGDVSAPATCGETSKGLMTCTASVPTASLTVSSTPYTVTATIAAAGDYGTATSANGSLTVNQATATVTVGSSSQTYTGAPISATATTNPASLPVIVTYTGTGGTVYPASPTPPTNAGTYTVTATVNSTNYTGTATGVITIAKATPTILWATPAAIAYGTALSGAQLDASATFNNAVVAGTYIYSPAAGAVLSAGQQTLNVSFTPSNPTDYNPAVGATTLTVNRATATVTVGSSTQTYTGAPISATATTNPASLPVTVTYTGTGGTVYPASPTPPTDAGTYTVTATVNSTNYTGTATGVITIAKATPTILWAAPAAITYGTALSGVQLDASAIFNNATVAGTYAYSPAAGTVLSVGQQTLSVVFTPTNAADYNSATGSVSLTVNPATVAITLGNLVQTYTGSPLSATANTDPTGVGVRLTYAGSSSPPAAVGSYPVTATVTNSNYTGSTAGTLIIQPATPAISLTGTPSSTLATSAVNFSVSVASASGPPTGTVTLMDGTTALGTSALTGGVAGFSTSSLPPGADTITAVYSGSTDYLGLSSAPITEEIIDFRLAPTGSTGAAQTVLPKVAATFQVAVIPNIGNSLPDASLLSVTGLAPGGTVTLNTQPWAKVSATSWQIPANIKLNTLSFTFNVPVQDLIQTSRLQRGTRSNGRPPVLWAIFLLPLALTLRRSAGKFSQKITLLLILAAGIAFSTTLSGCGDNVAFPIDPQTYNITVTLTCGPLTHSTVLTLAVK